MSALANTTPQKPSSSTLPSPTTTTGSGVQATPPNTALGSSAPAHAMGGAGAAGTPGNYYTGPYNTGPTTGSSPAGAFGGGYASNAGGAPGGSANSGYQSPYATAPAGSYRTADARSSLGGAGSAVTPANPYATSTGAQAWGTDSYRGGSLGNTQVAPAGYGATTATGSPQSGYGAGAAASTPSAWNTPAGSYGTNAAAASSAGLNTRSATFRPGSTSRSVGALGDSATSSPSSLPTPSGYPSATNSAPLNGTSAYPTSAYNPPATSGFPTTTAPSQATSYGGYSYPTTGQ